jgi:hypothetical protein
MFTDNLQVLWYARPTTFGSYLAALIVLVGVIYMEWPFYSS